MRIHWERHDGSRPARPRAPRELHVRTTPRPVSPPPPTARRASPCARPALVLYRFQARAVEAMMARRQHVHRRHIDGVHADRAHDLVGRRTAHRSLFVGRRPLFDVVVVLLDAILCPWAREGRFRKRRPSWALERAPGGDSNPRAHRGRTWAGRKKVGPHTCCASRTAASESETKMIAMPANGTGTIAATLTGHIKKSARPTATSRSAGHATRSMPWLTPPRASAHVVCHAHSEMYRRATVVPMMYTLSTPPRPAPPVCTGHSKGQRVRRARPRPCRRHRDRSGPRTGRAPDGPPCAHCGRSAAPSSRGARLPASCLRPGRPRKR